MKNLLNLIDLNKTDINIIYEYSKNISESKIGLQNKFLANKSIGLIFEKYSTRTRISFQVGINHLGGLPIDIKFNELNIQRSESFEDTFKMFNLYLDGIVYRTNDHQKLIKASNYFHKPLINGLSDLSHPCQVLADMFTLKEHFLDFENINISWFGDMNNVLYSYFEFIKLFPEITLNVFTSKEVYKKKISSFPIVDNINFQFKIDESIIANSNCIMTDVYQSMNDSEEENNLKEQNLINFQINNEIMNLTQKNCVFAHCLPAKIGSEVTKEVLESEKSIVIEQAKNRMIVQKGILCWMFG